MSGPLIQIRELHKVFDRGQVHALRGVDLDIGQGEGVILLGHNGSGKSTLLRCLNHLETPSSGTITFDGLNVANANHREIRELRRRIGIVFQRFNLVGNLTSYQNVLFGAIGRLGYRRCLNAFAPADLRREAMQALDRVGLMQKAGQRADELSGGQQQRIAIARTLVQRPEVMLADEPIASLDPRAAKEVMELLWDVGREQKFTVICTLHQLEIALSYGDRIVGLKAGQKVLDTCDKSGLAPEHLDWLYSAEDASNSPLPISSPSPRHHESESFSAAASV
jgi:phosphonate transport system ATP-binding protein